MLENGTCQIALHIVSLCIMFQCTHVCEIMSTEEMRGQKAVRTRLNKKTGTREAPRDKE